MDISKINELEMFKSKTKARDFQIQTYPNKTVIAQSLKGRGGRVFLCSSFQLPCQYQGMQAKGDYKLFLKC